MNTPTTIEAGAAMPADPAPRAEAEPSRVRSTRLRRRLKDPGFWAEWTVIPAFVVLLIVFGLLSDVFLTADNIESVLGGVRGPDRPRDRPDVRGRHRRHRPVDGLGADALGRRPRPALRGRHGRSGWRSSPPCSSAALVGFVNGFVIAKARISDFIVTLGTLSIAAGIALVISDGKPVEVINRHDARPEHEVGRPAALDA